LFGALNLLAVTIDGSLILLDLLLIGLILLLFLTLHIVTDQCAGAESKRAADGCTGAGRAHGRADDSACCRAAERANPSSLFPSR